jgi:hypothetical protein
MLNPFFQQGSISEQNLIQDLINEQLRMYGVEVYYIPRKYLTEKTIMREVIQSVFDDAYPIEAYLENYEGYDDNTTILSKFGIQSTNEVSLVISKERWETYIQPLIKNESNIKLSSRPKEGDLVYFPLGDRLFEIKFVEHEKPFYQLQKNYVYTLKCELFRYEDEVIDTGVDSIDDILVGDNSDGYSGVTDDGIGTILGPTQTLTLVGASVTATALTDIVNGAIRFIRVTNRGGGYATTPTVAISSAPSGGVTGVATAVMIGGINVCNLNVNPKLQSVQAVQIQNAGYGYTSAPKVRFISDTGEGAEAITGISTIGSVGIVTITEGGSGYTSTPTVTFSTPKHVGAAATAILDSPIVGGGVSVVSAIISVGSSSYLFPGGTTGGVFYKKAPTVIFSLPTGTGNAAEATATLDGISETGGTVETIAITTGGKYYTSNPTVTISHPGFNYASATIGIAGSSIDPSSIAFSTTGRAYRTAPSVAITTSYGQIAPTQVAVGIATIDPITGIVTAVSFDSSDSWAVGTGATIGAGYTASPLISFSGTPSPIRATATATVSVAGTVNSISIGNSGFGYASAPTVTISSPSGVNEQFRALGITTIRFNSVKTTGTLGIGSTSITGIVTSNITVGDRVRLGAGYSESYNFIPEDTFVSSIGSSTIYISSAATNVGISTSVFEFGIDQCGIVTGIAVTYGGGGYLSPPTVTISNEVSDKNYVDLIPGISTATGISTISVDGSVTAINIIDSGYGYVLSPEVSVSAPSSDSFGNFIFNEIITGSISSVTGRVRTWNSSTNVLEVSNISGSFLIGEDIVGSTSGATHALRALDTNPNDGNYSDNSDIEIEADSILDFTEQNPFGIP